MQNEEELRLACRPCGKCGKIPRIVSSLIGGFYVTCPGDAETRVTLTKDEAVKLWNEGSYEDPDRPTRRKSDDMADRTAL